MSAFRRLFQATVAKFKEVFELEPETKEVNAARSVARLAARRISAVRKLHAVENGQDNLLARAALWGGAHPLIFATLIGLFCVVVALPFLPAPYPHWVVFHTPRLPADYSHATFFGTIWTVQVTLVALVYPIVLTFVPILLQRRASSKFALAFYLRDSAVLPAGISSLMLLMVLSVQYLAAYYVPRDYFLFGAVFVGLWLLTNIGLTGYFLVKTVRYVEEDVGEKTYRRLSLGYVLWADLQETETKHLYGVGGPSIGSYSGRHVEPLVRTMAIQFGHAAVFKQLHGNKKLVDVDLFIVNKVAQAWATRAKNHIDQMEQKHKPPILEILPSFGNMYSGRVAIARVQNGPQLTLQESCELERAFVFARASRRFIEADTKSLLDELASEVQAQLERGRFDEAALAFRRLRRLHEAFLHSLSTEYSPLISSPALQPEGLKSVADQWLDPYRSILEIAACKISANQTLWRELCAFPCNLLRQARTPHQGIVYDTLEQYELIDHFIGSWWTREAHRSLAAFDTAGALLPEPMATDYQNAISSLVSGLNARLVPFEEKDKADEQRWAAHLTNTWTWMSHAESYVKLLMGAVRRGDRVAAGWYSDGLSHWLSDRAFGYAAGDANYFVDSLPIHPYMLDLQWSVARNQISQALARETSLEDAIRVLWQGLHHHWNVLRVTCALLLQNENVQSGFLQLADRVANNVLSLTFFNPGPSAEGPNLFQPDQLLSTYLSLCCLNPQSRQRAASLISRVLRRGSNGPVISGWTYTGVGYSSNPEDHAKHLMTLLLASTEAGAWSMFHTRELCQVLADLETMRATQSVLSALLKELEATSLREQAIAAARFRDSLGLAKRAVSPSLSWRRILRGLRQVVNEQIESELLKVSVPPTAATSLVARLQSELLKLTDGGSMNARTRIDAGPVSTSAVSLAEHWRRYDKATFLQPTDDMFPSSELQKWARQLAWQTLHSVLKPALSKKAAMPISGSLDAEVLLNLVAAIRAHRLSGGVPAIIAPYRGVGSVVSSMHWAVCGRSGPPIDVQFSRAEAKTWPFTDEMINGAHILNMETPGNRIYLVPDAWLECLVFEQEEGGSALQHDFEVEEPNSVWFRLRFRAELPGVDGHS